MWEIIPNFCQSHGENGSHELKYIKGKRCNFITEKRKVIIIFFQEEYEKLSEVQMQ